MANKRCSKLNNFYRKTINRTKFLFITYSSNLFLTTETRCQLIKQNDTLFLPKIFLAIFFRFRQTKQKFRQGLKNQ